MDTRFLSFLIVCFAIMAGVAASDLDDEYVHLESVEVDSSLLSSILSNSRESSPYEFGEETKAIGATIDITKDKPSFGVSVGAGVSLLKPKLQILGLIEAFLKLKAKLLSTLQALINENYDLIQAVLNFILSNATNLSVFTLKGISVLKRIIEFALYLFSEWNVGVSVGVPHQVYGVPAFS